MNTLSFRVKIGYGANDFVSIGQEEYVRAVKAQIKKTVFMPQSGGSISGGSIISVLPDWNKELGYNSDYQLKAEDLQEVPRIRQAKYREFMEDQKTNIERQAQGFPALPEREENPVKLYTQGMTSIGDILKK